MGNNPTDPRHIHPRIVIYSTDQNHEQDSINMPACRHLKGIILHTYRSFFAMLLA